MAKKPTKAKAPKRKKVVPDGKPLKQVYVIMPFRESLGRNGDQLKSFFENHIKRPIEGTRFSINRYQVRRSDETFNINGPIIKDLYAADLVIADLSGIHGNPNVMYELGMRLGFSNDPVILIRAKHEDNETIFDIGGFYAELYDSLDYSPITAHIIEQIKRLERGDQSYTSPVLEVLKQEVPLLTQMSQRRAATLLENMRESLRGSLSLFAGAATEFIERRTKLRLGESAKGFYMELVQNEELSDLDWSSFAFRPAGQPAVDHYVATRYLVGLIDEDDERAFTYIIMSYCSFFLSGDYMYSPWVHGTVIRFAAQTEVMLDLADLLIVHMTSTDKSMAERALQVFRSNGTSWTELEANLQSGGPEK